MESALRPRDIQARIRAGETLEDVAAAAGVPADRIEAFAAPIIAERDHVAGLAQVNPVRRRGETTSHRTLRNTVTDALAVRGVEARDIRWDAWKLEDRRWQIRAAFPVGSEQGEALFVYDQSGRFSVAEDKEGRSLIGDDDVMSPATESDPDAAPTFLDDQLALVRAVQDARTPAETDVAASPASPSDVDDAYREGELTEVDGVYDLVPESASDMDVLYDMLSSFDEDSVKIYSGLVHPATEDTGVIIAAPPEGDPDPAPVPEPERPADEVADVQPNDVSAKPAEKEPEPADDPAEPVQLSLIDEEPAPKPAPKKPARRRRASVPSWDEIMFGSPSSSPER